ncbi:hypothetical protein B0H11DRAFT_2125506 [Mycena galericulata]|nr:hypothetical protein B0H11DRAFT_2125506 [Mycena galericulata]
MSPEFAEQLDTPILAEAPPSLSSVQKLMSVLGVLKAQERAAWLAHLFLPVARSLRSLSETFGAGGATLGLELGLDAASALEVHNRHRRQRSAASRTPASPATTFEHEYKTRQWLSTARRTQRRVSDGSETDTDEDTTPIFTFRSFFDASLVSVEPPKTRAVLEPLNSPTAATCSPRTRTTTAESLEEGEIVEEEGAGTALDGKRGSSPAVPCTPVRNISAAKSPCHSSRRPKSEGENIMPRQSFGISSRYHPYNRSPSVSPRRHNL